MELIYAWIEKFRNYEQVELKFSNRFNISYNKVKQEVDIEHNDTYVDIYPDYIANVNAIVGKNSVGKTNLLDLLGLKVDDRNKNNAEYEIKYKKKNKSGIGFRIPDDIDEEIKHSIYFFIYFYGKDDNDVDLFCFEGNDIESYVDLIKSTDVGLDIKYFSSKYWFPFICKNENGKFVKQMDLSSRLNGYFKDGAIHGDYRSEQDKLAIISLREKLNAKYYDYGSIKRKDDYKISVPRRVAKFDTKFLSSKVKMFRQLLMNPNRQMYKDNNYVLKIKYDTALLSFYDDDDGRSLKLNHTYTTINKPKRQAFRVIEAYVRYFYNSIAKILLNGKRHNDIKKLNKSLLACKITDNNVEQFKQYYFNLVKCITEAYFEDEETRIIYEDYRLFVKELLENPIIRFDDEYIFVVINKDVDNNKLLSFIEHTYDENIRRDFNETTSAFANFFEYYTIEDLGDGEKTYLGIFASLYEQISLLTPDKERYIVLLDEPESRMHPDLARSFINELIIFLNELSNGKKEFQIIISTHSPFILSDIPSGNIVYLQKDELGYCIPKQKKLNTFGVNIHTLLKDGFFMESTMGKYAMNKVSEVILFLSSEKSSSSADKKLTMSKDEAQYIISIIGEPIVKNKLEQMFYERFPEERCLEDQIIKYKEQIEILRNQITSGKIIEGTKLRELKIKLQDTLYSISNLVNQDGEDND